tara:strand:- start:203 stop:385 length:183 start_codon:yes stop_codon:yes gene_type:complete
MSKKKKVANRKFPKPLMIYLTDGMHEELKKVAEQDERPVSSQLRFILRQYLMDRASQRLS